MNIFNIFKSKNRILLDSIKSYSLTKEYHSDIDKIKDRIEDFNIEKLKWVQGIIDINYKCPKDNDIYYVTRGLYDTIQDILDELSECIKIIIDAENHIEYTLDYALTNHSYIKTKKIFESINIKSLMVMLTENKIYGLKYNDLNKDLLIKYFGFVES